MLSVIVSILSVGVIDAFGDREMKNTFEIESWDESPYLEFDTGAKYSRAKIVKSYSGEMIGKGQLEYLMAYNESGAAYFTGVEHFEGSVGNRLGSFTIVHQGTFSEGEVRSTFRVIEGSQSAELIDLTGEGSYKTGHSMLVSFEFTHSLQN